MKVRDVIKLVENDGWRLARTKGSHRQFHHPTKLGTVTVAGHPSAEMPIGTLNNIQTGWAEEMKYLVIYEKSETGWGAYVPDLPGLGVAGATMDEVKQLVREAIDFHLEGMRLHGEPIPEPSTVTEYVTVGD